VSHLVTFNNLRVLYCNYTIFNKYNNIIEHKNKEIYDYIFIATNKIYLYEWILFILDYEYSGEINVLDSEPGEKCIGFPIFFFCLSTLFHIKKVIG